MTMKNSGNVSPCHPEHLRFAQCKLREGSHSSSCGDPSLHSVPLRMTLLVEVRRYQSFSLLAGLVLIALIAFPAMVQGEYFPTIPKPLSIRQSAGHFTLSEKTDRKSVV